MHPAQSASASFPYAPGACVFSRGPGHSGLHSVRCALVFGVRQFACGRILQGFAGIVFLALIFGCVLAVGAAEPAPGGRPGLTLDGGSGPGAGRHIVFVTGEEFYRSEEGMSMFAKILALRHGFKCTVLYAMDPQGGFINPNQTGNIPGLAVLDTADVLVLFARFRELPDADMKHIVDFVDAGKPVLGIRNATHAFRYAPESDSPYKAWDFRSREWPGGFGRQILGDTWIAHYGKFQKEATRAHLNPAQKDHPALRGVADILFCHTDVNSVLNLGPGDEVLFHGQVLSGLNPDDPPVADARRDVRMPFAWFRTYTAPSGKQGRAFTTTAGASLDWLSEDLRRLVVNALFVLSGLGDKIPAKTDVAFVGEYRPGPTGMISKEKWAELNLKPAHFAPSPK